MLIKEMRLRGYSAFGDPIDDVSAALTEANTELYAAVSRAPNYWPIKKQDHLRTQVDDWNHTAVAWMNIGGERDPNKVNGLLAVGSKLLQDATDIKDYAADQTLNDYMIGFAQSFPDKLQAVTDWVINYIDTTGVEAANASGDIGVASANAAGDIANAAANQAANVAKKAAWTTGEVVLVVGLSAVAVLYLANKAGVKINLPLIGSLG